MLVYLTLVYLLSKSSYWPNSTPDPSLHWRCKPPFAAVILPRRDKNRPLSASDAPQKDSGSQQREILIGVVRCAMSRRQAVLA